jgi:hypothetical protein
MPTVTHQAASRHRQTSTQIRWEEYFVADYEILHEVAEIHAEVRGLDFTREEDGTARFVYEDTESPTQRKHIFAFDEEGGIRSTLISTEEDEGEPDRDDNMGSFMSREEAVHSNTMGPDRLNALVGRANKVAEIVDHFETYWDELVEHEMDDLVMNYLFPQDIDDEPAWEEWTEPGPVRYADGLREYMSRHDPEAVEEIPDEFYERFGAVEIDHEGDERLYDRVVAMVAHGEREEGYEAAKSGKLDPEIVTKDREMWHFYSQDKRAKREEYRRIWEGIGEIVREHLDS